MGRHTEKDAAKDTDSSSKEVERILDTLKQYRGLDESVNFSGVYDLRAMRKITQSLSPNAWDIVLQEWIHASDDFEETLSEKEKAKLHFTHLIAIAKEEGLL